MGLIRLLLIFAVLYFAGRFIGRILFPPRQGSYGNSDRRRTGEKEGDITVEDRNTRKKHIKRDDGDYIDYEEVNN